MRVLFTTHPASGHFHPLVPLARALQQAGHEVAFASAEVYRSTVEHNGFHFLPAGIEIGGGVPPEQMRERMMQMLRMPSEELFKLVAQMFIGVLARSMLPDLLKVTAQWRPDVIVRDTIEFSAPIVADRLGIPCASVQVGAARPRDMMNEAALAHIRALRASVDLPPGSPEELLFDDLHLCFAPPFYLGQVPLSPTTHYLRSALFDQSGDERLPEWAARLGERPVVYATLGTVVNKMQEVLGVILEGLRDEPVDLVMTVGRDQDPAAFGPQPPHVHVERYIPQTLLFPKCDLAIIHGGYGSVTSALTHGLPVVVVPIAADQPINAARCQEMGVGRVLDVQTMTPAQVRDTVREVLANPSYRAASRRYQQEAESLPGIEYGVALVERLAAQKTPVLAPSTPSN